MKSRAGRRGIVLPEELYELLTLHRTEQDRERQHAGTEWHEGGWMFAQPNGQPIDSRRDWADWKTLLEDAGVREARLHDARHTAATVLLLLGVPERAVMDFMGWSNSAMAKRYQHVTAVLRNDIAKRLSRFSGRKPRSRHRRLRVAPPVVEPSAEQRSEPLLTFW